MTNRLSNIQSHHVITVLKRLADEDGLIPEKVGEIQTLVKDEFDINASSQTIYRLAKDLNVSIRPTRESKSANLSGRVKQLEEEIKVCHEKENILERRVKWLEWALNRLAADIGKPFDGDIPEKAHQPGAH